MSHGQPFPDDSPHPGAPLTAGIWVELEKERLAREERERERAAQSRAEREARESARAERVEALRRRVGEHLPVLPGHRPGEDARAQRRVDPRRPAPPVPERSPASAYGEPAATPAPRPMHEDGDPTTAMPRAEWQARAARRPAEAEPRSVAEQLPVQLVPSAGQPLVQPVPQPPFDAGTAPRFGEFTNEHGQQVLAPSAEPTGLVPVQPAAAPQAAFTQSISAVLPEAPMPVVYEREIPKGPIWPVVVGCIVLAVASLAVVMLLSRVVGVTRMSGADLGVLVVLCAIPFIVIALGVMWLDRWEPEPRWSLALAIAWGAGIATGAALLAQLAVEGAIGGSSTAKDELMVTVVGPISEELAKGALLLVIVWLAWRQIGGPIDGFVYGALTGLGFALVENIMYLAGQLAKTGEFDSVWQLFVSRGLLTPFIHVLSTGALGLVVGYGVRGGRARACLFWLLGLVPAIALHMAWNTSVVNLGRSTTRSEFTGQWIMNVVFIHWLPTIAAFLLLIWLRNIERRRTKRILSGYAQYGWFSMGEVQMLGSWSGRSDALRWARGRGPASVKAMRAFQHDATRLAHSRMRIESSPRDMSERVYERMLLERVGMLRHRLIDVAAPAKGSPRGPVTRAR